MDLPIFKRLTGYAMARKFGTHISWTHITRAYDVEMREIVYFKNSGNPYMLPRANRGGSNPLEALCAVLPLILPPTPLLNVLILEAEVVLLGMAQDDWRRVEERIEKVCAELRAVLDSIPVGLMVGDLIDLSDIEDMVFPPKGDEIEERPEIIPAGIRAAPGEDDDL